MSEGATQKNETLLQQFSDTSGCAFGYILVTVNFNAGIPLCVRIL
jgi:hypothetical protein